MDSTPTESEPVEQLEGSPSATDTGATNALELFVAGAGEAVETSLLDGVTSELFSQLLGKMAEALVLVHTGDLGLAAAMSGATAGTAKGIITGGQRLWALRRARLAQATDAARQVSGLDPAALLERASQHGDERRLDLLIDAFNAAAREADVRRVRAYGRLAAKGVTADTDSEIDITRRVFRTLSELDELDLKLLLHMARQPDQIWLEIPAQRLDELRVMSTELPELAEMLEPILARLTAQGLLTERLESADGSLDTYQGGHCVSPFARMCIRELMRGDDAGTGFAPG